MIQYQLERLRIINLIFLLCYNDIEMGNNMKKTIIVNEDSDIITYLKKYDMAKNKIKTYIKLGFIYVNDKKIKLPYKLNIGDIINIITEDIDKSNLDIIYEDNNYLIVNKVSGLLTISTDKNNSDYEDTLYKRVRSYLNKKHEYVFIVNRIDKETSGIVIFVKNDSLKKKLQDNWNNIVKFKLFIK